MSKIGTIKSPVKEFRDKVQYYCHQAEKTQHDLADRLNLAYTSLNKKLNGQRRLTSQEIKQIILALAEWQSFETEQEISQLLNLAGYDEPDLAWLFSPQECRQLLVDCRVNDLTAQRGNIPRITNSFVGRQTELAQLKDLLVHSCWLTLTGMGGCGKTRLALQLARQLLSQYAGSVWLVELINLRSGDDVEKAVALALKVKEQPGRSRVESIIQALKDYGPTLLVIDNCEHLLQPSALLIEQLLQQCPQLTVLATSRERLSKPTELVFEVKPLSIPSAPAGSLNLAELRTFDAVRLFEERARQSLVSFKLERGNAQTVRQICADLDGIPLALELAASRLQALSLNQLQARLNERFRLLGRDPAERISANHHQTLRALFDWSYELLSPGEQQLFRRLGVFVGGARLEAVQEVCDEVNLDVLAGLMALVQKNLLKQRPDVDGQPRYFMLKTLQEYALEKLEATGESESVQAAYEAYYLNRAELQGPRLNGTGQLDAYQEFSNDYNNLRVVLQAVLASRNAELIQRVGPAIHFYWFIRSYWDAGGDYLKHSLMLEGGTIADRAGRKTG